MSDGMLPMASDHQTVWMIPTIRLSQSNLKSVARGRQLFVSNVTANHSVTSDDGGRPCGVSWSRSQWNESDPNPYFITCLLRRSARSDRRVSISKPPASCSLTNEVNRLADPDPASSQPTTCPVGLTARRRQDARDARWQKYVTVI